VAAPPVGGAQSLAVSCAPACYVNSAGTTSAGPDGVPGRALVVAAAVIYFGGSPRAGLSPGG